jgi:hypothetical protein
MGPIRLQSEIVPEPARQRTSVALYDHAADTLDFIRTTMARSATFTAVPGVGGIAMGIVGLGAAWISTRAGTEEGWLRIWLAAAAVAAPIGLVSMHLKARRAGLPLWSSAGRRFALGLAPPLVAGAALTASLARGDAFDYLPGTWLLLYGVGLLGGAISSVPLLTALGCGFMALGVVALAVDPRWGTVCLAAGFGGLQIVFGFMIARRHGG